MVVPKGKPFGFNPHSGPKRSWAEERKTDRSGANIGLASWFFLRLARLRLSGYRFFVSFLYFMACISCFS